MWPIAHHLWKLLAGSAISMCLTFHWPMQVTWSPLTSNWNGTVLSCIWKESQAYLRVAPMIIPGIVISFDSCCLHPYNFMTEDCVSPIFYSMGSHSHTICKWQKRIWEQICWILTAVLIPWRLPCIFQNNEFTFTELTGSKFTCFVCFISFSPHNSLVRWPHWLAHAKGNQSLEKLRSHEEINPYLIPKTALCICTLLQHFLEWTFFMRHVGCLSRCRLQASYSPSEPALGEGVVMLTRMWYPWSCCHAHSLLSHCPWRSTLLLVASQQIKNTQQNPSPLPWLTWLSG